MSARGWMLAAVLCNACLAADAPPLVIVGDPQPSSAVVWSRAAGMTAMHVRVRPGARAPWRTFEAPVRAGGDSSARATLDGLTPATRYEYEVWFTDSQSAPGATARGELRTAPADARTIPLRFVWGGDVGGQNICRDALEGYPVFRALDRERPDFFIALGDMVYADDRCLAQGKYGNAQVAGPDQAAVTIQEYWAMWRYNRADAALAAFVAHQPYVAVWDDHEVLNDFGPETDMRDRPPYTAGKHMLPLGLAAFLDENPIAVDRASAPMLYRTFTYGAHVQVFVLDARSYRSANTAKDLAEAPKSMLGAAQLAWLTREIARSKATWNVIVSSVPLALLTGDFPRGIDSWASFDSELGYERELRKIVDFLHAHDVRNVVWLTTDVHYGTGFRYRPIEADPAWEMHEFVSGPLNAQSFPRQVLDLSFNPERLFFFGPAFIGEPKSWEEAKRWFNYGVIEIDRAGKLTVSIKDVGGAVVRQVRLAPGRKARSTPP